MRFGVYFLSIYSKEKNTTQDQKAVGAGDAWTWVGIDADTKLVVSWFVGSRDADSANIFMNDVATRLKNRVQLTTDGLKAYLEARNPAYCKCAVIGSHTFRPKVCLVKFSSHFF